MVAKASSSDTLLRHLKKVHNAIDAPDLEASLGMAAENPDELREIGGLGPAVDPIFLVSGGNVTIEDGDYQVIDDSAIQNPGNTDEDCVPSLLDQSWWLDYDFDPNSLDVSLFEPMTLAEPFRQLNVPFNDCQLLPHDRTLPGKDIHKAWFTYIPDSRSSDTLQGSAALQSSTPADNNGAYELDENFRIRACEKLTTCLNVDPLPSTGLLVSLKPILPDDPGRGLTASCSESLFENVLRYLCASIPHHSPSYIPTIVRKLSVVTAHVRSWLFVGRRHGSLSWC